MLVSDPGPIVTVLFLVGVAGYCMAKLRAPGWIALVLGATLLIASDGAVALTVVVTGCVYGAARLAADYY